ncbi:MAG: SLBB domain-containing protein, partial [Armatimonadota bacterium]|nr:SLBB domain-containing protein [Armatimonadota bacterium]
FLDGAFAKVGAYPITGTLRVLDALALAGGAPTGDLSEAVLTQGRMTRNLNLEQALRTGDPRDNVEMRPNAHLYVPVLRKHITVQGQVTIPRNLDYKQGMGIQEAVAAANGPTDFGDRTHVRVVHANGRQVTVDLQKIMDGTQDNIMLQPDDVVTVPEAGHIVVQGQVTTPKNIQLKPNMTLEQAVAESGGPKERANESAIRIDHKDGTSQTIDLLKNQQAFGKDNTLLQADDVITVPEQLDVTVQGQVTTPKNILFKPGMTLTEAVTAAGGSTDKADNTQVLIVSHDGQRRQVDWNKITTTGVGDTNVLQPGDTVTVPEQLDHILVTGEVAKPVVIPYRPNLTLDAALAMAGGATPRADQNHIKLQHINGNNVEVRTVDLLAIQQDPSATTNKIILQPGDSITVPEQNAQVFVTGQVNRPGAVQYRPGMNLLEALG